MSQETDFTFVVDVSKSMASSIEKVKSVLKCASLALTKYDTFSLISFSDRSNVLLKKSKNKAQIEHAVHDLQVRDAGTNLYAGTRSAIFNTLDSDGDCKKSPGTQVIFIFTDGQANVRPPLGTLDSVSRDISEQSFTGIIYTFATGPSPSVDLLDKIAKLGNGTCSTDMNSVFKRIRFFQRQERECVETLKRLCDRCEFSKAMDFLGKVKERFRDKDNIERAIQRDNFCVWGRQYLESDPNLF